MSHSVQAAMTAVMAKRRVFIPCGICRPVSGAAPAWTKARHGECARESEDEQPQPQSCCNRF